MPLKKVTIKVTPENEKKRLDQALSEFLPQILNQPLSKAKARKLIIAGAVYLNRKRVRIASKELHSGAMIEIYIDLAKLNSGPIFSQKQLIITNQNILFEDEYLIAVNKPSGIPTQPTL